MIPMWGFNPNLTGGNPNFDLMGNPVGAGGAFGHAGAPNWASGPANPTQPTLPGAPPNAYNPAYGGIPQEPNPAWSAHQATGGNIANLSSIEELTRMLDQLGLSTAGQTNNLNLGFAGQINDLNQRIAGLNEDRTKQHAQWEDEFNRGVMTRNAAAALLQARSADQLNQEMIQAEMERNVPGYTGLIGQRSHNIEDELAGKVSDSTWNQLAQRAAERGAAMGTGVDSPGRNAALLAALGQTSEGQQARGASELSGAIAGVPHAPLQNVPIQTTPFAQTPFTQAPYASPPFATPFQFDPSNMLIGPRDVQGASENANWLAAAPQPAAAARENLNRFYGGVNQGRGQTQPNQGWNLDDGRQPTGTTPPGSPIGGGMPYSQPPGSGNMANWVYDPETGGYYNQVSGQYAGQPGGANNSLWPLSPYDMYGEASRYGWNDPAKPTVAGDPTANNPYGYQEDEQPYD